ADPAHGTRRPRRTGDRGTRAPARHPQPGGRPARAPARGSPGARGARGAQLPRRDGRPEGRALGRARDGARRRLPCRRAAPRRRVGPPRRGGRTACVRGATRAALGTARTDRVTPARVVTGGTRSPTLSQSSEPPGTGRGGTCEQYG